MAQPNGNAKTWERAFAFCGAACCAAASVAFVAPGSRLLGVSLILGVFAGLVRRVAVLSGIRIIPALVRRTPAF